MSAPGRRIHPRIPILFLAVVALVALAAGSASALVRQGGPAGGPRSAVQPQAAVGAGSSETTSVIVQNNSGRTATIVMYFHTPGGVLIPLATQIHTDVAAWSTRTFDQSLNTGLLPGFRGVGVLSSDQPLNALLVREVTATSGERSYAIQNAYPRSGKRVALPYVANQLDEAAGEGTVNTRFSIANASLEAACVTITYSLMPGRGATPRGGPTEVVSTGPPRAACPDGGFELPVAGQLTLAPGATETEAAMPAGTVNSLMSVLIDSTQAVTVSADIYRGGADTAQLGSYTGFIVGDRDHRDDDVSTSMTVPLAQKTADGYWTELAITNPWTEPVRATVQYFGTVGGDANRPVEVSLTIDVPAGGSITQSALDIAALPEGFLGAALIDADAPLAALVLRGKRPGSGQEDAYSAANAEPRERLATTAKFPLIFRNAHGAGAALGYNSWVSVAVADGATATLRIVAVNNPDAGDPACDTLRLYTTTVTIEGSFFFDQGSANRLLTGLSATPGCVTGGMAITSDKPIAAVGGVTSDLHEGDNDGLYNAFP